MPMFDFVCTSCAHTFDALVRGDVLPACPACGATKVEKLLSLPAIKTSGTHDRALAAAKRRDASQGQERMHAQRQYELSHDD
ncbi:zinc ribbon domain-containing protein [Gemmatimonas aurantiaca]|uniref:FmdB family zinc ribbon protein n=1 Tax=Gemmatimonas aurantiaca TaxID=173480 RepID=UPI00301CB7F1